VAVGRVLNAEGDEPGVRALPSSQFSNDLPFEVLLTVEDQVGDLENLR